jgi:hypothetical protein
MSRLTYMNTPYTLPTPVMSQENPPGPSRYIHSSPLPTEPLHGRLHVAMSTYRYGTTHSAFVHWCHAESTLPMVIDFSVAL